MLPLQKMISINTTSPQSLPTITQLPVPRTVGKVFVYDTRALDGSRKATRARRAMERPNGLAASEEITTRGTISGALGS